MDFVLICFTCSDNGYCYPFYHCVWWWRQNFIDRHPILNWNSISFQKIIFFLQKSKLRKLCKFIWIISGRLDSLLHFIFNVFFIYSAASKILPNICTMFHVWIICLSVYHCVIYRSTRIKHIYILYQYKNFTGFILLS